MKESKNVKQFKLIFITIFLTIYLYKDFIIDLNI